MAVAQANPVNSECLFYLRSQIGRFNKLFLWSPVVDTDGSYLCKLPGSKTNVVLQHSPNAESKTVRSEQKKNRTQSISERENQMCLHAIGKQPPPSCAIMAADYGAYSMYNCVPFYMCLKP